MTIVCPTTMYHRTLQPRIVTSQEQYDALGPEWADTPAAFYDPPPAPESEPAVIPKRRGRPKKEPTT